MMGHEFLHRLRDHDETASLRVVYMSGFGTDLPSDPEQSSNVIGSLNKPFTSEVLLSTVATYMPNEPSEQPGAAAAPWTGESAWAPPDNLDFTPAPSPPQTPAPSDLQSIEAGAGGENEPWWSAPPAPAAWPEPPQSEAPAEPVPAAPEALPAGSDSTYFSGDTSFFSLNWALHTIAAQKLTGTFRAFWSQAPVELLARDGQILLVTTRDPALYCPEAPITLVNIAEERAQAARQQQRDTGRPLFLTLAQEELILREPALQLVQHHGQKLFAQLWTASRVRILFEQAADLPDYANDIPPEGDVDHWALSTLRFIQYQELGSQADYDPASVPAYTRDGFERVQRLRLTVAEAQFASQFNGARSIAQIAKNLRLDLKFARLTLFRFLALEIVECWPPNAVSAKPEKRGVFGRMFRE